MTQYCEALINSLISQPFNVITSLAFLVAAYFAYKLIIKSKVRNSILWLLPILLALTGVGSVFWHIDQTKLTDLVDLIPITAFILLVIYLLFSKLFSKKLYAILATLGLIIIEIPFYEVGPLHTLFNNSAPYIVILIATTIITFLLYRKHGQRVLQAILILILFALAILFRSIDNELCSVIPTGTHFLWHILNAFVGYLLVKFFITLEEKTGSNFVQ